MTSLGKKNRSVTCNKREYLTIRWNGRTTVSRNWNLPSSPAFWRHCWKKKSVDSMINKGSRFLEIKWFVFFFLVDKSSTSHEWIRSSLRFYRMVSSTWIDRSLFRSCLCFLRLKVDGTTSNKSLAMKRSFISILLCGSSLMSSIEASRTQMKWSSMTYFEFLSKTVILFDFPVEKLLSIRQFRTVFGID